MNQLDMYDALLYGYRYKTDGCYPSNRYSETNRKDSRTMDIRDVKILLDGHAYTPFEINLDVDLGRTVVHASAEISPKSRSSYVFDKKYTKLTNPIITNVIFNPPATIVFWSDKTKTIVKADYDYESYDPEKGLAMAIAKKMIGDNKGNYYEIFKHWRKKWDKQNEETNIKADIPKDPLDQLADTMVKTFSESVDASDWP